MRRYAIMVVALAGLLLVPGWLSAQVPLRPQAYLGVVLESTPPGQAQPGVRLRQVEPGGPAEKAGLKAGDVIVGIDGKPVRDFNSLSAALHQFQPGDKVKIQVQRNGDKEEVEVTLGRRPRFPQPPVPGLGDVFPGGRRAMLGITMQEITPELKQALDLAVDQGVLVVEVTPNSPAAKAGLKLNDVIVGIDGKEIKAPRDLADAIGELEPGKEVTLQIMRGKDKKEVKAKLADASTFQGRPGIPGFVPNIPEIPQFPPFGQQGKRIEELEKRIQELEKRIQELEKRLGKEGKQ